MRVHIDRRPIGVCRLCRVQVNNAALLLLKPAAEWAAEDYARIMATNLESCLHISQLAHPLLLNASVAGGASIVNVSSIASVLGFPQEVMYSVTKGTQYIVFFI